MKLYNLPASVGNPRPQEEEEEEEQPEAARQMTAEAKSIIKEPISSSLPNLSGFLFLPSPSLTLQETAMCLREPWQP